MAEKSFEDEVIEEFIKEFQRQNQEAFAEAWGPDFTSMLAESMGFCPSPDGSIIGVEFRLRNGAVFKASIPYGWMGQFFLEMKLAIETAAARLTEGQKH